MHTYFQLKGDLIMVSANVVESMKKILPIEQNLVPVSLKRKMEYTGHYMEENVDRLKLQTYFRWFQRHNHLFKDFKLDETLVDKFENEAQNLVEKMDGEKDDIVTNHNEIIKSKELVDEIYESDEEHNDEESTKLETEYVSCDHSSVITNKYIEDINAPTIANRFSDMILSFEQTSFTEDNVEIFYPDSEEAFYVEDEVYDSEDEIKDDEDLIVNSSYSDEDLKQWNIMNMVKKESRQSVFCLQGNLSDICKCGVEKKIALILDKKYQLEKLRFEGENLIIFKNGLIKEFLDCIEKSRKHFKTHPKNCHHIPNSLNDDIENFIIDNEKNPEKTMEFVNKQTRKIKENLEKVSVAPGEEGKLTNWKSDIFLEEKLFPKLFPYGIGGYLSSNMLKNNNMGYSNYIKNRVLSADPKFRNDSSYVFFLLLVKELTDMKRSEQTYFRKATKIPDLTAQKVNEITKENLFRYNNAYATFKTIRGTSMYYQDTKKKLMATLRQKGPPTLFNTFSCADFEWDTLAKSIYETVNKTQISLDEVKAKPSA